MAKRMTIGEFLVELRKTPRRWRNTSMGLRLRRITKTGAFDCCPITALAPEPGPFESHRFDTVGRKLGLSRKNCYGIVSAADFETTMNGMLRVALFEACGLKVPKK